MPSPICLLHILNLNSQNNNFSKRYNKFTKRCLCKLYLRTYITKTYITSSKLFLSASDINYIFQILSIISHNLTWLSCSTSHPCQLNLSIILLLDTTEDSKHAMLTSMKNSVMNVTYLQYYPIRISSAFILPTISPFGTDGNIDEKHLLPRIPTTKYC